MLEIMCARFVDPRLRMRFHTPPGDPRDHALIARKARTRLRKYMELARPGWGYKHSPQYGALQSGSTGACCALQLGRGLRRAVVAPARRGEQVAQLGPQAGGSGHIAADRPHLMEGDLAEVE